MGGRSKSENAPMSRTCAPPCPRSGIISACRRPTRPVGNFAALVGPDRAFVAEAEGALAGGCCSFPMEVTTPGGRVKAAGVTMVGVQPTHRRRGVLSAMMRRQLDDCRARGEPLAYLWASEERIYGRFGYGLTALSADVEISRDRADILHEGADRRPRAAVRRAAGAGTGAHDLRAGRGASRPGMFAAVRRMAQAPHARRCRLDAGGRRRTGLRAARNRRRASGLRALPLRREMGAQSARGRRARGSRRWRRRRTPCARSGATCSTSTGARRSRPGSCRSTIRCSC